MSDQNFEDTQAEETEETTQEETEERQRPGRSGPLAGERQKPGGPLHGGGRRRER